MLNPKRRALPGSFSIYQPYPASGTRYTLTAPNQIILKIIPIIKFITYFQTLSLPSCFRTNSPPPLTHTEPKSQRKFVLRASLNVNDYASFFSFLPILHHSFRESVKYGCFPVLSLLQKSLILKIINV